MAEPIDLDALEQHWLAGSTLNWYPDASQILDGDGERVLTEPYIGDPDTEFVCAVHNAFSALLAELRAARKVVEASTCPTCHFQTLDRVWGNPDCPDPFHKFLADYEEATR